MKKKEIEAAISDHAEWIKQLAAAQTRTQAQIEETNRALKQSGEATDKRIAKLVSAIGELIQRMDGGKAE